MSAPSATQGRLLRQAAQGRHKAPGALRRLFPPYTVRALERRGMVETRDGYLCLTEAGVALLEDGHDRRAAEIAKRAAAKAGRRPRFAA